MNSPNPYRTVYSSDTVLDAVEQWASWAYLLRETGAVGGGRLDGLLVPTHWNAPIRNGVVGVEVKVSRADFLRGLREEQFQRYQQHVNGLYLAAPRGVCKTRELPVGVGHLVVTERDDYGLVCVCRKHPAWTDRIYDTATLWRVLFDLFDQFERRRRDEQDELYRLLHRIKHVGGDMILKALYRLSEKASEVGSEND